MDRVLELQKKDSSVISVWRDVKDANSATLLSTENIVVSPYYLSGETPSWEFLPHEARANENINTVIFMDSIYKENYLFSVMSKRELTGFSFSKISDRFIPETSFQSLRGEISSTWTENFAETEFASKFQAGLSRVIERLIKFSTLKIGWDSYSAGPIKWLTVSRSIDFLSKILYIAQRENKKIIPIPFVAPVNDGSIQFEWKTCYRELIHSIPQNDNDYIEYLKIEKSSLGEREEEGFVPNIDNLVEIVSHWLL